MIGSFNMAKSKVVICPYCGETQPAGETCRACGGLFEPLSRQATHNAMGPWYMRDPQRPFQPGASYATITRMIERGQINKLSIIRGPTTKQFWTIAKRVPGIAHLLGYCHACDAPVKPEDHGCHVCGARFGAYLDRNYLGLPEIRPLPWEEAAQEAPETSALTTSPPEQTPGFEPSEAVATTGGFEGGRISSFATDEELLGPAGQGERAWGVQPSGEVEPAPAPAASAGSDAADRSEQEPAAPPPAGVSAPPPASAPIAAPSRADESAMHLAQRRSRRLQQTVNRLWLALLIVLLINIVLLAVLAFGGGAEQEPAREPAEPGAVRNEPAAAPGEEEAPLQAEPAHKTQPSPSEDTASDDADTEPAASDQSNESAEADEPANSGFATVLADAEALIEAAQDDSRALADRIADYETALKLLKSVQANAPNDAKPDDLDARIDQAERDLERLRLREFFP